MICLNCITYTCSCHGGIVGLVYKNLINETEEKLKKKTKFDEEEGNDWWLKKLTIYNSGRQSRKCGINAHDEICASLFYCKKCDKLWEKTGNTGGIGGKYKKTFYSHYTRKDMPFYGFINNKEKQKICVNCK